MSINDDIISLRERVRQAIESKVFDPDSGGLFQTSMIEIMKKAEIKRQQCQKQAEHFERQKVNAEGQAAAYGTISSVVNQIVQSMISLEERRLLEEQELDEEKRIAQEDIEEEPGQKEDNSEDKKPRRRKKSNNSENE